MYQNTASHCCSRYLTIAVRQVAQYPFSPSISIF